MSDKAQISLSLIRTDGGTQARDGINEDRVAEYMERLAAGDEFPPVEMVYDGESYWPWDGFHRINAYSRLRGEGRWNGFVSANVVSGTQRDARRKAAGANAVHGLPRTAEDKRRAVLIYLEDEEWQAYSDRQIAAECKVSPTFVGKVRKEVVTVHVDSEEERKYITRHGTEATMKTANIGSPLAAAPYLSITDIQTYVMVWVRGQFSDIALKIQLLQDMKDDRIEALTDLMEYLGDKRVRKGDVRQAINNQLDALKQQAATRHQGELEGRVMEFGRSWEDGGRTWQDIENPSHTNGTFWQQIVADFRSRGLVYNNEGELKFAIKAAWARLKREKGEDGKLDAACSHCQDMAETTDMTTCSCGRAICEDCYFEHGHADHDTLAVNVWLREGTEPPAELGPTGEQPAPVPEPETALTKDVLEGELATAEPLELAPSVDPKPENHWGLSNGMPFWKRVYSLGLDSSVVLHALQDGATHLTDLEMTRDEAFERLEALAAAVGEPAPANETNRPRVAGYVRQYFQAANEAITRIATALPKSCHDDFLKFMAVIDTLEELSGLVEGKYEVF